MAVIRGSLPDREPPLPRLLQGLAALLRNLAAQAAVIAVLDDVHFADASSWEALRYFARHLDDTRLLVVATSRPADLAGQEAAAQALFELDEDEFLRRLEVTPLDRNTTRELAETIVGQPPPAALVDWVDQRARGNPLYVISLVRALLEEHADLSAPGCFAPRSAARRASSSSRSGRLRPAPPSPSAARPRSAWTASGTGWRPAWTEPGWRGPRSRSRSWTGSNGLAGRPSSSGSSHSTRPPRR